jgi:drug/metabolite transporter (DMT)-like permease
VNQQTKLYLFLALTIVIWGYSFVAVQAAIDDGSSPILIAMARWLIASSIFGAYLLVKRPPLPERSDMPRFLALAFIGVGVYYIFQYYGVKFAGASISSILVTLLCPVVIFLVSYVRLGEHISPVQAAGLALSAVGGYFVITNGSLAFIHNWEGIVGGLFGVVCAVFWALYTLGGKQIIRKYDALTATAYLSLMGSAMLAPFAAADAVFGGPMVFPLTFWIAAVYLGVLCTVVGYVLWFKALTGLTASSTGVTLYFEPLVTVIAAWLVLGQTIGWMTGLGGVLVMVGVLLVSRR